MQQHKWYTGYKQKTYQGTERKWGIFQQLNQAREIRSMQESWSNGKQSLCYNLLPVKQVFIYNIYHMHPEKNIWTDAEKVERFQLN